MRRFQQEWAMLVAARSWIGDRGYRLVESRGPEGMDCGLDLYTGARLGIRIVADRSQWFVEIRPEVDHSDWFDLERWGICIDAPAVFRDLRGRASNEEWWEVIENSWWLQPQLEYLAAHLQEIERACEPTRIDATLRCLEAARIATAAFPPREGKTKKSAEIPTEG